MQIEVKVKEAQLSDVVSEGNDYHDEVTLADMIVQAMVKNLTGAEPFGDVRRRIADLRDEEIRKALEPMISEEVGRSIQRTNAYGEPTGHPISLRDLIVEEARKALTQPVDRYSRDKGSVIEKIVREEIVAAFRKELQEAVKDEREKAVQALRTSAADILAETLARASGRL